jgi:hypothetical protein
MPKPILRRNVTERDLARHALASAQAPTLPVVGGNDAPVIDLNRDAMQRMRASNRAWLRARART